MHKCVDKVIERQPTCVFFAIIDFKRKVAALLFWIYTKLLSTILEMLIKYRGEMTVFPLSVVMCGGKNTLFFSHIK